MGKNIVSLVSCYHPPRRTVRDPLPEILVECGINLAVNLSSRKPTTTRITYVHRQLMLSKINYMVIARYMTRNNMAITK